MSNFYIERQADHELDYRLRRGDYCCVLSPPQTGKTMLLQKVKSKLEDYKVQCAVIELRTSLENDNNTENDPTVNRSDDFYHWMFIKTLAKQLVLPNGQSLFDQERYKDFRYHSPPISQLLRDFIENVLLEEIKGNIVIFVDELDELISSNILSQTFSRIVLETILYCYSKRKIHPRNPSKFNNLTFALFGRKSALKIVDYYQNYNQIINNNLQVELNDFQSDDFEEEHIQSIVTMMSEAEQLSDKFENWEEVIREILRWTRGQALLTRILLNFVFSSDCQPIYRNRERDRISYSIKQILFSNLEIIRYFDKINNHLLANSELFQVFQQVLDSKIEVVVDRNNSAQRDLFDLGLIRQKDNQIEPHNPIYRQWFTSVLVEQNLPSQSSIISTPLNNEVQNGNTTINDEAQNSSLQTPSIDDKSLQVVSKISGILNKALIGNTIAYPFIFALGSNILSFFFSFTELFLLLVIILPNKDKIIEQVILSGIKFKRKFKNNRKKILLLFLIALLACFIQQTYISFLWQGYQIGNEGTEALEKFKNTEIEALEIGISAGKDLEQMNSKNPPLGLRDKAPTSPLFALQTILSQIKEKNRIIALDQKLITAVSFNPKDENIIATGSKDGILQLWNKSGKSLVKRNTKRNIHTLNFSPNGNIIATGSKDGSVKIWNSSKLQFIEELPGCHSKAPINSLSFDRDANYLVTGGSDGRLCLWNLNPKEPQLNKYFPKKIIYSNIDNIYQVSFHPSNHKLLVAKGDGNIDIIDILEFSEIKEKEIKEREIKEKIIASWQPYEKKEEDSFIDIFDLTFNQDGTKIATAGKNGIIKIWDDSGNSRVPAMLKSWNAYQDLDPNSDKNPFLHVTFDKANKLIAIVENKDILRIWKYSEEKIEPEGFIEINNFNQGTINEIGSISFNPKTQELITVAKKNEIRLWELFKKTETISVNQEPIKSISVRSDHNDTNSEFKIALLSAGMVKKRDLNGYALPSSELEKYGSITSISFTHDGEMLATGNKDGEIQFWKLDGEKADIVISTQQKNITSISLSPLNNIVAVANRGGTIKLWKREKKIPEGIIPNPNQGKVELMSFSSDSKLLVTVGSDKARLWNVSNLEQPKPIETLELDEHFFPGGISGVGFTLDRLIAITARRDSKVTILNSSGKLLKPLDTQQGGIVGISFSQIQKNNFFVTAGTDGTIKVWDRFKPTPIANFPSNLTKITSISFSPDGKYVVAGGDSGKLEVWSVPSLEELLDNGCNWLKDYHSTPAQAELEIAKTCQAILEEKAA